MGSYDNDLLFMLDDDLFVRWRDEVDGNGMDQMESEPGQPDRG